MISSFSLFFIIYEFIMQVSLIELVQIILENDPPTLPSSSSSSNNQSFYKQQEEKESYFKSSSSNEEDIYYSDDLRDFLDACLVKNQHERASAEDLFSSPYLESNGATSYESSVENVCCWIESLHGKQTILYQNLVKIKDRLYHILFHWFIILIFLIDSLSLLLYLFFLFVNFESSVIIFYLLIWERDICIVKWFELNHPKPKPFGHHEKI